MKEKEWEARAKRDSEMIVMMQNNIKQQEERHQQMLEQNKMMFDVMKKFIDKFMYIVHII